MQGCILRKWLAIVLLLVGIGQLSIRTLRRGDDLPLWDFTPNYLATNQWFHGGDPYDIERIRASWHDMTGSSADVQPWWSVYPPTTFVVLAPVGALPLRTALFAWGIISTALFLSAIFALSDLGGFTLRDARTWLLVGGVLCSAPAQFGLMSGQPTVAVLSLAILAVWAIARRHEKTAGALLAIACAIKPQVAAPFVAYYLVLRKWRVVDLAVLLICVIAAATMILMHATHVDWVTGWSQNLRGTVASGGVNDPTSANPWRDQMINLSVMLQSLVHSPLLPRVLAMCVTAVLLALYVRAFPRIEQRLITRARGRSVDLLPLATLTAMSLLPVYHRIYDALVLCLAFAWALSELDGPRRRFAVAALFALSIFLVPFNVLNSVLYRAPQLTPLSHRWWWQVFLVPHYAWAALLACVLLLRAMWRARFGISIEKMQGMTMHRRPPFVTG
jgi:hypothetical protein